MIPRSWHVAVAPGNLPSLSPLFFISISSISRKRQPPRKPCSMIKQNSPTSPFPWAGVRAIHPVRHQVLGDRLSRWLSLTATPFRTVLPRRGQWGACHQRCIGGTWY
jgi:hypothetical protein